MKIFPYGNAGPHDVELVELIQECDDKYGDDATEFMSVLIDNINELFKEEIELAWQYRDLTK